MPLRGQNNVQGSCDMGCLPYYTPDYNVPKEIGLMTPDMIEAMEQGALKALFNMGEDIAHIHPNQNRIHKALKNLELLIVNEIFENEITGFADIIFGVKSAYEKEGVYINAERRMHLSAPLIDSDLPDDWEVFNDIASHFETKLDYASNQEIWQEVQTVATNRFSGASYEKLKANRLRGLQWPVKEEDTPILHLEDFRTKDGFGYFRYNAYQLRGMVEELLEQKSFFYLTTGRILEHYNNSAQTKHCEKLIKKHDEDILLVSYDDMTSVKDGVVLASQYGKSAPLKVKFSKGLKKGTLYTTFHHAKSKINFVFGDECDDLIKTARFKSVKVWLE
jgi:formate dehydrogenase major subunit